MLSPAMKRKLPLSLPAVLAAALLPAAAFVGCNSTDVADAAASAESGDAVAGPDSSVEIVRPASAEALDEKEAGAATAMADAIAKKAAEKDGAPVADVADASEAKEPKKFRLFGMGKKKVESGVETGVEATPEVAATATEAAESPKKEEEESEPVAEPKRGRKPLFARWGKNKDKDESDEIVVEDEGGGEPEVAAVKEKKKFRLFGFGRKKDEAAVDADETVVADNADAGEEVLPVRRDPESLPWEDPAPEIASNVFEETVDPEAFADFPDTGVGAVSGVTARIRPGESSGGFTPMDETPSSASSALDRIPSLSADPAPTRPRDDGFVPLTPEPKFPGEEGILPPGN